MLRLFKKKGFLIIFVTLVLFVVIGITASGNSKLGWFGTLLNSVFSPVQKALSVSGDKVDSTVSFFKDSKALKDENKILRQRVEELEKENDEFKTLKQKNEELKEALNLKNQLKQYQTISANIIAKDLGNWFNVFTIDKGTNDGVVKDCTVIASKGLVGRVLEAGPFSSKVITVIDIDSTVSARLTRTRNYVEIKGDLALGDQGLCKMYNIEPGVDITVGDRLETSGTGGIYPKGITVGKVKEVRQTNNELDRYAIVEPVVDFTRLEDIYVLITKK